MQAMSMLGKEPTNVLLLLNGALEWTGSPLSFRASPLMNQFIAKDNQVIIRMNRFMSIEWHASINKFI